MLSEFVEKVSVVDEYERPDAEECLRILMKLLYKIPSNGTDRLNALMEKVMEVVDDLSSPMDDIALLVECLYVSLSRLFFSVGCIRHKISPSMEQGITQFPCRVELYFRNRTTIT